jgi:hypothetical protein
MLLIYSIQQLSVNSCGLLQLCSVQRLIVTRF